MPVQPLNKLNNYYDSLGRLTQSNAPYGGGLATAYDNMANRSTQTLTTPSFSPPQPMATVALPKRQKGDFTNNAMMVSLESTSSTLRRLIGWGNCTTGVLSNNVIAGTNMPAQVALFDKNTTPPPSGIDYVDWAFTNANLYVVYSNGWVYSAGRCEYGQLGHGDLVSRPYLKRIEFFVQNNISITKVWAAGSSSLAGGGGCVFFKASDGRIFACGANAAGNLGNPLTPVANVTTPAECAGVDTTCYSVLDVVITDVGGNFSTYMPCSDGRLMVAGYNGQGQLGVTLSSVTGTFVRALQSNGTFLTGVASVSATSGGGGASALVIDTSGFVWTTGLNSSGQLGLSDTTNRSRFTKISSLSNIVKAELGGGSSGYGYAQDIAGVFYTWGYNAVNNLFLNNATNPISSPTVAAFLPDAVAKVFFPREDNLGGNAQFTILTAGGRLAYAGLDNGQIGINNAVNPGAYKWLPIPEFMMEGMEVIVDAFVHGTSTTQRLFVITNRGNLYACGYNADSVCTGGYSSNIMPTAVSWYRIPLSEKLLSS